MHFLQSIQDVVHLQFKSVFIFNVEMSDLLKTNVTRISQTAVATRKKDERSPKACKKMN